MSASAASICPLRDGAYRIMTRNSSGQPKFLAVFPSDGVGLSTDIATEWFLAYMPGRGSYRIWQHTTNKVLDATRVTGANATVWGHHGADWQQWAIRLQTDPRLGSNRVTGYTLTPLSQPQHVLTMGSGFDRGTPATPAQLREAPRDGGDIPSRQIWVFVWRGARTRVPVLLSAKLAGEPAEEGQPWEFGEEFDFESSYCEEVQAQIAQAKE